MILTRGQWSSVLLWTKPVLRYKCLSEHSHETDLMKANDTINPSQNSRHAGEETADEQNQFTLNNLKQCH